MLFRTTAILSAIGIIFANEAAPGSSGWCGGTQDEGVWIYEEKDFKGLEFHICPDLTQCINVDSFNDRASSAHWQFGLQGSDCFCFYENPGCQGKHRCWGASQDWYNQPSNFALDDIDNQISSVSRVSRAAYEQRCIYEGINWTTGQ